VIVGDVRFEQNQNKSNCIICIKQVLDIRIVCFRLKESLQDSEKKYEYSESRCSSLEASLKLANSKLEDFESYTKEMGSTVANMEAQHEAKLAEFTR